MMLRFWLVCLGILFVMVELWGWLQELTLPFSFCVLGGLVLAIVSNLKFSPLPSSSVNHLTLPPKPSDE